MASPSVSTVKKLFLRTGNRCAFPNCEHPLISDDGILIAEVCHICADQPGGKRYDPAQSDAARQSYENLIVLCPTHHTIIDGDDLRYTAEVLREMRRQHEKKSEAPFEIGDVVASSIASFLAGITLTANFKEIAKELGNLGKDIWDAFGFGGVAESTLRNELLEILRYGPKGTVLYFARDPAHLRLAAFLIDVFKESGWHEGWFSSEDHFLRDVPKIKPNLVMFFLMSDSNQVPNAQRMIEELLERCEFVTASDGRGHQLAGTQLSVYFAFGYRG